MTCRAGAASGPSSDRRHRRDARRRSPVSGTAQDGETHGLARPSAGVARRGRGRATRQRRKRQEGERREWDDREVGGMKVAARIGEGLRRGRYKEADDQGLGCRRLAHHTPLLKIPVWWWRRAVLLWAPVFFLFPLGALGGGCRFSFFLLLGTGLARTGTNTGKEFSFRSKSSPLPPLCP